MYPEWRKQPHVLRRVGISFILLYLFCYIFASKYRSGMEYAMRTIEISEGNRYNFHTERNVTVLLKSDEWGINVPDSVRDVMNDTLGFGEVFSINLLERTDRRDAMDLMSALTGFSITWLDGVKGTTVSDKALPHTYNRTLQGEGNVGSTRAHLNVLSTIIRSRLATALIMEDDLDWDVSLKSQLADFALGVRFLANLEALQSSNSSLGLENKPTYLEIDSDDGPYGTNWDILWPGHCAASVHPAHPERFTLESDPTVPPLDKLRAHRNFMPNMTSYPPHTRLIHHAGGGMVCTAAYAVSIAGAKKLMYLLSMADMNDPYDIALQQFCRDEILGMRCFTVFPQLMGQWRERGSVDSDIKVSAEQEVATTRGKRGFSHNIAWSSRGNAETLLRGLAGPFENFLDYV